jgi:hypothetical protein
MLLADVVKEDIRKRNLAEIYTNYLFEKFRIDRDTSTQTPAVRRPLSLDEDYTFVCGQLFRLMTTAAGRMYQIESGEVRMLPDIRETDLRLCAKEVAGETLDLPSILSNAVLVPTGQRDVKKHSGLLSFTFAHKSFQAFFFARYVISLLPFLVPYLDSSVACSKCNPSANSPKQNSGF